MRVSAEDMEGEAKAIRNPEMKSAIFFI